MRNKKTISILLVSLMVLSFLTMIPSLTEATPQQGITFWTTETEASRMAVIEGIASRYTGVTVTVVGVDEADLPTQVAAAAAAGTLPDVMQIFYEYIGGYCDQNILDPTRATTTIGGITDLGGLPMAVNPGSTGASDLYGAVPIDGWVQGIWYRQDLFTAAGLDAPDSYENIYIAAETLHDISDPMEPQYGIVIGTDPTKPYTQQVYEHFAMANGARALDKEGNIVLNSERQAEALNYYANLSQFAPAGFNNWDAANQLYLTNKTAMMVYSTYIADDILGLQARPWTAIADLGSKTGFQAVIEGYHGDNASYGQLGALGICVGADSEAEDFIQFILNTDTEYLEWIHMAITGKMPLKQSTAILNNWTQHEVWGSYEAGLADNILDGFKSVARWGLIDGKSYSTDIATLYGELIMPKAITAVISDISTVAEALDVAEYDFYVALGRDPPTTPPYTFVTTIYTTVIDGTTLIVTSIITSIVRTNGFSLLVVLFSLSAAIFIVNRRRRT